MLNDINGKRLRVGQTVRRAAYGSDIIPCERRAQCRPVQIEAIGTGEHLDGLIRTSGALAWESPANFERV